MKATVTYEGIQVAVEDASGAELRELIFALKDGPAKRETAKVKRGRPPEHELLTDLNSTQLQTLQYLQAHDSEEGVQARDMAAGMDISLQAVYSRIKTLVDLGLAHRIPHPGRGWRAGEEPS